MAMKPVWFDAFETKFMMCTDRILARMDCLNTSLDQIARAPARMAHHRVTHVPQLRITSYVNDCDAQGGSISPYAQ
jgi:hypothetical protein